MPSHGQKIAVEPGWYLPAQKILLAETAFFRQVMELKIQRKSRQCFTIRNETMGLLTCLSINEEC